MYLLYYTFYVDSVINCRFNSCKIYLLFGGRVTDIRTVAEHFLKIKLLLHFLTVDSVIFADSTVVTVDFAIKCRFKSGAIAIETLIVIFCNF